jgi:hypothetical protein
MGATGGRRHAPLGQAECELVQTDAAVGIGLKQLLDNRHLDGIDGEQARIPRAFRMPTVAIGHAAPGQQLTTADLGLPAPAHPLGNQGPLVLGHRTPDLEHQLVVRIIAHRAIQKLDLAAGALQFFQDYHLMQVVASQPIRCGNEHQIKRRLGGLIAQVIEARAFELGAALTIVAEDMCFGQTPVSVGGHIGAQAR